MLVSLAFLIIAVAVYFVIKGVDVRLVLFTAGLALASLALKPWLIFDEFLKEMANGKTIGPICSAMGYAFVLRAIGSDQEMVRLLIAPIRRVKWLLVPGGCAVGFLTNMAITQSDCRRGIGGRHPRATHADSGLSPDHRRSHTGIGLFGGWQPLQPRRGGGDKHR